MQNMQFYNLLSSHYDDIIKFEKSLKSKMNSLKWFIEPNFRTALDLGCGTGVDSIVLSQLGLKVDAVDHSKEMIITAKKNSIRYNVDVNYSVSDLKNIGFNKRFDFIVSLGNTLANIPSKDLSNVFGNIKKHLTSNGKSVIQIINYESLPSSGDYILHKFENESFCILRKYTIQNKYIYFIIEILNKLDDNHKQIKTKIYPHTFSEIKEILNRLKLNFDIFGSLNRDIFIEGKSKNLVLLIK